MTMPKLPDLKACLELLRDLESEHESIQADLDGLIGEMERVPPEQRSAAEWGPSGTLTTRYLELSERQSELVTDIERVSKTVAALTPQDDPPPSTTKH